MGLRCAVTGLILALLAGSDQRSRQQTLRTRSADLESSQREKCAVFGGRDHPIRSDAGQRRSYPSRVAGRDLPRQSGPNADGKPGHGPSAGIRQGRPHHYQRPHAASHHLSQSQEQDRNHRSTLAMSDPSAATAAKPAKAKEKSKIRLGRAAREPGTGQPIRFGIPNVPGGHAKRTLAQAIPGHGRATSRMDARFSSILPRDHRAIWEPGTSKVSTRPAPGPHEPSMPVQWEMTSRLSQSATPGFLTDLKVTVLSETDDGQAGHSTMKLVNIVRSEPNAALFEIPADYTVKENALAARSIH